MVESTRNQGKAQAGKGSTEVTGKWLQDRETVLNHSAKKPKAGRITLGSRLTVGFQENLPRKDTKGVAKEASWIFPIRMLLGLIRTTPPFLTASELP